MTHGNLINLHDVYYAYPHEAPVLNGVNFCLAGGDSLGLMGPNGAGKTTFLHVLMGLLKPTQGTVELFGIKPNTPEELRKARLQIGFLFQNSDDQLFSPTVLDDVAFGPLNQGLSREQALERARTTLQTLGLESFEPRVPYRLSGGEKKLVALATILAMEPKVLILDEPTTGLSPEARKRLMTIINDLDTPRLVVSHDADFLSHTTDSILAMRNGVIRPGQLKPHTHMHVHAEGDIPHEHG